MVVFHTLVSEVEDRGLKPLKVHMYFTHVRSLCIINTYFIINTILSQHYPTIRTCEKAIDVAKHVNTCRESESSETI